jgi:ribosomal protein S18 acetylase RimI-like enzyme
MNNQLTFRTIEDSDIKDLCLIHKNTFSKDHFSTRFSNKLLENYFRHLIKVNEYSFICKKQNLLVGYVIGGKNIKTALDNFLKENKNKITLTILKNPSFIYEKVIEFISKILKIEKTSKIPLRLFLIAINPNYRSHGIGKEMIRYFEMILLRDKISEYGLSVRKDNTGAINFYRQLGYIEELSNQKVIFFKKTLQVI